MLSGSEAIASIAIGHPVGNFWTYTKGIAVQAGQVLWRRYKICWFRQHYLHLSSRDRCQILLVQFIEHYLRRLPGLLLLLIGHKKFLSFLIYLL